MTDQETADPVLAEQPAPRRRIPVWVIVAAMVVVVAAVFGIWRAVTPSSMTVHGTVTLGVMSIAPGGGTGPDGNFAKGDPCAGNLDNMDIASGAEVDVLDAAGKVLGSAPLGDGVAANAAACVFPFTVANVPAGASIYGVKVGNASRGIVHFSGAQMAAGPALAVG